MIHLVRWPALLLVSVVLTGCPEGPPPPALIDAGLPAKRVVATLVQKSGQVRLTRAPASAVAAALGSLYEGDVLETGDSSRAVLESGPQQLELSDNTRFVLGASLGRLDVENGELILYGDPDAGAGYLTPLGRARLAAGGSVRLSKSNGGYEFKVGVGELEVFDEDGGVTSAAPGQRLRLALGTLSVDDGQPAKPPEPAKAGAVKAVLESGRPLLKAPGAKAFTPAPKELELAEGSTSFSVPAGARLRVEHGGVAVRLANGANGTVDRTQGSDADVNLSFAAGGASVRFTSGGTVAVKDSKVALVLKGSGEANANLITVNGVRRVEVITGTVSVASKSGGPETEAKAGEFVMYGPKGQLSVQPRPRALMTLPSGRTSKVYGHRGGEIGLRLAPGKKVHVVVASDPDFADVIASGDAQEVLTVPVPATGQLHWKVQEPDGPESVGHARFLVDAALGATGARSDVVAETGQKATVYFQSTVPSLTFNFTSQEAAKGYQFRLYRATKLDAPLLTRQLQAATTLVESGALSEGSFVWSATPLDERGKELAGARMNKMDIVFDNSLTTLEITAPKDGAVAGADVVAAGIAPKGARLSINGKSVTLEASGRFSQSVGKVDVVVFDLVTSDGVESFWARRLRR